MIHIQDVIIIIIIYFENIHFFHAHLGLDVCPQMKPLHISLNTAHSGCKPSSFMSSFTVTLFLPLPTHLSLQISTGRHPIIPTFTLQMLKPSQSAMPHHLSYTLNTKKTVQNLTVLTTLSVLQRHSTYPSHHHTLCYLQAMQIPSLYCPCPIPVRQHTLGTSSIHLSYYMIISVISWILKGHPGEIDEFVRIQPQFLKVHQWPDRLWLKNI